VLVFGLLPDTGYDISAVGTLIQLVPGYSYRTTDAGALSFTMDFDATCGDGAAEGIELCDGGDFAQYESGIGMCPAFDSGFDGGDLGCDGSCRITTDGCSGITCHDGVREGHPGMPYSEECDPPDFGAFGNGTDMCSSYDASFVEGSLACLPDCAIDISGCVEPICGDGNQAGLEECDGEDFGPYGIGGIDACRAYDPSTYLSGDLTCVPAGSAGECTIIASDCSSSFSPESNCGDQQLANDYYVDIDGLCGQCDDSRTKSQNNVNEPWCTIARAVSLTNSTRIGAGDTLYVQQGSYGQNFQLDVEGTAGNPLTFIALEIVPSSVRSSNCRLPDSCRSLDTQTCIPLTFPSSPRRSPRSSRCTSPLSRSRRAAVCSTQ